MLDTTPTQWIECDYFVCGERCYSPVDDSCLTFPVDVYLPEGRSHETRYASNGVRAPVKRIGIIAEFQTCGWL